MRPGGIPSTSSSSLFSCPPLSSRIQPAKHTAALPPDSLQTQVLATPFPAVKSVTPGPGTMTVKPMSALSVTSALCASAITKLKPVLNGSIPFHHIAKTPSHIIDYVPHQLTHRFLPPFPQPVSQPTPIVCHLSLHQVFLSRLARPPLRVSKASSTPQRLFSPLGPILPAIGFLYLPNSSTLQDRTPFPFVYQYPLVSKCRNGDLGYKTTTTPTSVTS